MTKKEQQLFFELHHTIDFLVNRMLSGTGGISSDAMLAEALVGHVIDYAEYPCDLGDLSRCFRTWLDAAPPLRAKMLWRLAQYTSHVSEKHISIDGVKDRS